MAKQITFTAKADQKVGTVVRVMVAGYKFWKIVKIVDGKAIAKALPNTSLANGAC